MTLLAKTSNNLTDRLSVIIQNRENANVRDIGKGEARHRKYKRLKLGGSHVYDHSSD
jgi:hypothetical protein